MVSRLVRIGLLTIFGIISVLGLGGMLNFYIHPRYIAFTTVFTLLGVLIILLTSRYKFTISKTSLSIILITAAVALALPPATLSSRQALFREGEQQFTTEAEFSSYDQQSRDLSRYDISDWASLIATDPEPSTIVGSSVNLSGFYLFSDIGPAIARFRVSCCAIDATPIVLQLDNFELTIDDWYLLTGTMQYNSDENYFFIAVDNAESISEPENPYVF